MFTLGITDTLEAIASVTDKITYNVSYVDGTTEETTQGLVGSGQTILHTAVSTTQVISVSMSNTHTSAVTVTLSKDPTDAGTLYHYFETLSLGVKYTLTYDGQRITVVDASGRPLEGYGAHAIEHVDGTDDIQDASNAQKGVATPSHISAIEANTLKVSNVTTNLSEGTTTETTVEVASSDGTNATLNSASTSRAGVLTKAKFDEITANTSAKHTQGTDTTQGIQAEDLDMGGNYAVALQNIPDLIAGRGAGYWFDGVDDKITAIDSINIGTGDWTYLYNGAANETDKCLLFEHGTPGSSGLPGVQSQTSGYFNARDDDWSAAADSFSPLPTDGLNHTTAIVWDRDVDIKWYSDGNLLDLSTNFNTVSGYITNSTPITLGKRGSSFGEILLNLFLAFNLALIEAEVIAFSSGAPIPFKYSKNDTDKPGDVRNSGSFVIGAEYIITTRTDGDFTTAGADDNVVGTRFTATATASGVLDAGDTATRLGCVVDYNHTGVGDDEWKDTSGNDLHGTVNGATPINKEGIYTDGTDSFIDGDLDVGGDTTLTGDLSVVGDTIDMTTSGTTLTVGTGADNGTVSAGVFTDRTKFPDDEIDALTEILKIKGKAGQLDHDSLPEFTKVNFTRDILEDIRLLDLLEEDTFEIIEVDQIVMEDDLNKPIYGETPLPEMVEVDSELVEYIPPTPIIGYEQKKSIKEIIEEPDGFEIIEGKSCPKTKQTTIYNTIKVSQNKMKSDVHFDSKTGSFYQKIDSSEVKEIDGKFIQIIKTGERVDTERDLGASISMNQLAIQQLVQENTERKEVIRQLTLRIEALELMNV